MGPGYTFFDTPIGRCAIAWGERGVRAVQLPERREAETRARLTKRIPDAAEADPSAQLTTAVDAIVALLSGEGGDLSAIELEMEGVPEFHQRVYQAARSIGPGQTVSYGDLATRIGLPGAARAVGQALARNPFPLIVPCHRVLAAGGRIGGFSADGGIVAKLRLLNIEAQAAAGAAQPGLGFDPLAAVNHLRATDARLARVIDDVGPCRMRIRPARSTFLALAESIVYQQLTGRAAATIYARVCALFPNADTGFTPQQLLRVPEGRLCGAGLSRAKLLSLRDLAQRAVAGDIPDLAALREMNDDDIVEQCSQVRGIGRWTVEMLLMFRLGRPDVLPLGDYGVRKGLGVTLGRRELPDRAALETRGERWRPYRTAASWYLWRAAERALPRK